MFRLLVERSLWVILLAVAVEELGVPSPIPTDVLIVFAGTMAGWSLPQLGLLFVVLTVVSTAGASGLYAIARRGGRPLLERFGRYLHFGPERLAACESMLTRRGWSGIAVGRAIPGLRYATVIACGLLKVPYPRFVTAHLAGSSVYIAVFLVLGAVFGPAVLERLHPPMPGVRLLWLLPLAVGLPLLVVRLGSRVRQPSDPSHRRKAGAVLLSSFAGATALAATLSATATIIELSGVKLTPGAAYASLSWLLYQEPDSGSASLASYAALLLLFTFVGAAYYQLVLPDLTSRYVSLPRQVLGLALLGFGLFGIVFASSLLVLHASPFVMLGAAPGIGAYALTAVYGRILVIAVAPPLRCSAS